MDHGSGVAPLEDVASTPDSTGEREKCNPGQDSTCCAAKHLDVESETKNSRASNLCKPVEGIVECAGANVELCEVDVVELVGVEVI